MAKKVTKKVRSRRKNARLSDKQKMDWAEKKFPPVNANALDKKREKLLRKLLVRASAYVTGYATSTQLHLIRIKKEDRYQSYFLDSAVIPKMGSAKFLQIAKRGGLEFTNEYMYCTEFSKEVDKTILCLSKCLVNHCQKLGYQTNKKGV